MGYKVKERRVALKMSQEELAEKSGVSRATISAMENDSEKSFSSRTLRLVAAALDIRVADLFFDESV